MFTLTICKAQVTANTPIIPMSSGLKGSQINNITDRGSYRKDDANKFNQWVGTWIYTNGNTEFKIVFTKVTGYHVTTTIDGKPADYYTDLLNGGYYYKENGVVKTNQLTYTNQLRPPLVNGSLYGQIDNKLTLFYREIDRRSLLCCGAVKLTLLPGSTNQASWSFREEDKGNYSVPDNVILTKQ